MQRRCSSVRSLAKALVCTGAKAGLTPTCSLTMIHDECTHRVVNGTEDACTPKKTQSTDTHPKTHMHTDTRSPGVGRSHSGSFLIPGSELKHTHTHTCAENSSCIGYMHSSKQPENERLLLHSRRPKNEIKSSC